MIEILRIVGAHGIRGAVRASLFSSAIEQYEKLYDQNGAEYFFSVVRKSSEGYAVISLQDVTDRTVAESLKGQYFYVKKNDLLKLNKNEFYICDLIGREVYVQNSSIKCHISDIKNFGAGDLIEISYENNNFFVPFTVEHFPDDCEDRIIVSESSFNSFKQ